MDLNAPALPPPDGITPNFDNPPNANDLAWGVLMACAAISTICVILRFYGRVFLLRKVQAEESMFELVHPVFKLFSLTSGLRPRENLIFSYVSADIILAQLWSYLLMFVSPFGGFRYCINADNVSRAIFGVLNMLLFV